MKKNLKHIFFIIILFSSFSITSFAQEISMISYVSLTGQFAINYDSIDRTLYLSCSYDTGDGRVIDDLNVLEITNDGSVNFWVPNNPQRIVFSIWENKILREECAERNGGTPCEYCERNGFHMENRIFSTGWFDCSGSGTWPRR